MFTWVSAYMQTILLSKMSCSSIGGLCQMLKSIYSIFPAPESNKTPLKQDKRAKVGSGSRQFAKLMQHFLIKTLLYCPVESTKISGIWHRYSYTVYIHVSIINLGANTAMPRPAVIALRAGSRAASIL